MVPHPPHNQNDSVSGLLEAIKVQLENLRDDFDEHKTDCKRRHEVFTETVRRLDRVEQESSGAVADLKSVEHGLSTFGTAVNARLALMDLADAKRVGFALGSLKSVAAVFGLLGTAVTLTYGAISAIHALTGGP